MKKAKTQASAPEEMRPELDAEAVNTALRGLIALIPAKCRTKRGTTERRDV